MITVTCNEHNLTCILNGRVKDMDAYEFTCPRGCRFNVTGIQLNRLEERYKGENEPI